MTTQHATGRTDLDRSWLTTHDVLAATPLTSDGFLKSQLLARHPHPAAIADDVTLGAHPLGLPPWEHMHTSTGIFSHAANDLVLSLITRVSPIQSQQNDLDDDEEGPTIRSLALNAVESLRRWLGFTDEEIAEIAGIAPRSIPNWRNSGRDPYPSTVRQLFEIHNLIAALVRRVGLPETAVWIAEKSHGEDTRLELLRKGKVATVVTDASRILFPAQRATGLRVDDDEDEDQENSIELATKTPPVTCGHGAYAPRDVSGDQRRPSGEQGGLAERSP